MNKYLRGPNYWTIWSKKAQRVVHKRRVPVLNRQKPRRSPSTESGTSEPLPASPIGSKGLPRDSGYASIETENFYNFTSNRAFQLSQNVRVKTLSVLLEL